MTLTPIIIAVSLCSLLERCYSFRQIKRRFSPQNFALQRPRPFMNYHFIARGGDSDSYEENDGTFSQFIESFEEELSEIRREVEIEAEIEMQKLLGLVDKSQKTGEEDLQMETVDVQQYDEKVAYDGEEYKTLQNNDQYAGVQTAVIQEVEEPREDTEDAGDEGLIDESELTGNELDTDESMVREEDDTYDLEKQAEQDLTRPIQESENIVEDEELESLIPQDFPEDIISSSVDEIDTEELSKGKSKKRRKSKSKKSRSSKSRKQRQVSIETPEVEDESCEDAYAVSSVSTTKEKSIESINRGLGYYLQTDLVRAVFLFIATVVVSIWLQRLQKQMEAQGI